MAGWWAHQLVGPKEATRAAPWVAQKAARSVESWDDLSDAALVDSKADSMAVRMASMSVHQTAARKAVPRAGRWVATMAESKAEPWAVLRAARKVGWKGELSAVATAGPWAGG